MNATDTANALADDMGLVIRLTLTQGLVVPSDIETATSGRVNTRYAREILAVLTKDGLFSVEDDEEMGDVWMINPDRFNADSISDLDSEREVWRILNLKPTESEPEPAKPTKTRRTASATNTGEIRQCLCGCGEHVAGKSAYRPGHDARHAGNIAREIAEHPTGENAFAALDRLPSERLRLKARAHAERLIAKAQKAGPKEAPFVPFEGEVKIGRWTYAVKSTPEGQYIAYKADGSVFRALTEAEVDTKVQWEPAK